MHGGRIDTVGVRADWMVSRDNISYTVTGNQTVEDMQRGPSTDFEISTFWVRGIPDAVLVEPPEDDEPENYEELEEPDN